MTFVLAILANAVALWVAAAVVPGIEFGGEGGDLALSVVLVSLVFGVLNSVVKPLLKIISIPLIVLTLGLFLVVVNALMLSLTSWLAGVLGLDFTVQSFWWDAVLGALIVSAVGVVTGMILPSKDKR
ncbi:phage holin family protein [Ornithinimicrobium pratense]|uniref:Phage holin family protein n=1 Tax=Ornithinimicrobium pratense TaxID=2593973 RepID=A0A5J6V971_9MICO|nr:phage holin family protein [Ornithinimicrobium pratense]QFG69691.1 phage holin family protein [Ornithinimicrobium pratense]